MRDSRVTASTPTRAAFRRHAVGSGSARGLLLTVAGEYMLPAGGRAWTPAFLDTLGRVGVQPGTVRQALARTAAAGWFASERVGRYTRWRLTVAGEQLLREGTERIYGFSGPARDWDGRWLVVLTCVPESDRAARHRLRNRLTWAGLGSPAPGVWVGTRTDRLGEVEEILERAGLRGSAQVFAAEHAGSAPLRSLVEVAWDLTSVGAEYGAFLTEFASRRAADPLARSVQLVHAWRRFPWRDPALPRELLPSGWRGARAAALFRARHDEWSVAARAAWDTLSADPD